MCHILESADNEKRSPINFEAEAEIESFRARNDKSNLNKSFKILVI